MNAILKSTELELHPLCTLFPRLAGSEFDALRDDIAANGLRHPIVMHHGMILDGGNRYRACVDAGVEPKFTKFEGSNLVSFVLSANLHRRHMTAGQQAAIVASATDWANAQTVGRPGKGEGLHHLSTVTERAAVSGATTRTQKDADKLVREAPALAKQVTQGKKSLYQAVKESKPSKILPRPEPIAKSTEQAPDPLDKAREHAKKQNAVIRELRAEVTTKDERIKQLESAIEEAQENQVGLVHSLETALKFEEGQESVAKEMTRLRGVIRVIEATRDQYMTTNAELIKTIKSLERKVAKLEKAQ